MGRSIFFEKNLRIQFDRVLDSESNGGIFDSLASFGGELWRFENLKFVEHLQPTQNFFFDFFLLLCSANDRVLRWMVLPEIDPNVRQSSYRLQENINTRRPMKWCLATLARWSQWITSCCQHLSWMFTKQWVKWRWLSPEKFLYFM